eukprot:CAMPEP_0175242740 /NCGR_PEP_ID=MMETSP0093-20121207/31221_1 /TAXON_ID=311494 /ORGANISM="Alexandrium monilatum, Strain CCMP3105" /LENGTH=202 /DNA_ID=CAMNT_0016536819 /DNA_START=69 /DNA_END=677 /DNA_ORIENTATION=+
MAMHASASVRTLAFAVLFLATGSHAMTFPKRLNVEAKQLLASTRAQAQVAVSSEAAKEAAEAPKAEATEVAETKEASKPAESAPAKQVEGSLKAEEAAATREEAEKGAKAAEAAKAERSLKAEDTAGMKAATDQAEKTAKAEATPAPEVPDVEHEDEDVPVTSLLQEKIQLERRPPTKMVCDEGGCTTVPAVERPRPKHDEF